MDRNIRSVRGYASTACRSLWVLGQQEKFPGTKVSVTKPVGTTLGPEIRQRLSEHKKGAKNPQWRGGITRQAITIRRGVNELRPQILERDGYRCRMCSAHSKQLEMHHIIPVWAEPELVLSLENIATVCRPCHLSMSGREMEYAERFDVFPDKTTLAGPETLSSFPAPGTSKALPMPVNR